MLLKIALTLTDTQPLDRSNGMVRTASGRVLIEPESEKEKIVQAEIKKHPNALFFRAKAIKADEPNSNGDSFSKEELLEAYKSFEGVPFFTNHENQDIEKAKGKIIFAEWDEAENSVYTIAYVDRDAYPHICRGIEQGYMSGVSMGASVEYSVCSICENKAERTEDYCEHIRNRKSRKFTGKSRNVRTGKVEQFRDVPVFEHNYGIKFIELSGVVDPACPSCHIEGIIDNTNYLGKVANMDNYLRMVRNAALDKEASQEEITQIDEVLNTLENISINLIKNRKQVEVDFASELVDIISNLQTWMDELVGAGYGNLESAVPGTAEEMPADPNDPMAQDPMAQDPMAQDPMAQQPAPMPVSSGAPMSVGQESGNPNQALVNNPSLPISAPMRPAASSSHLIRRVADERIDLGNTVLEKAASLFGKINKTGVKTMGNRRTMASKKQQREKAMEVLSSKWQEKLDFFSYMKEVPSLQDGNIKVSVKNRDDSFVMIAEDESEDRVQIWTYEDFSDEEKQLISESPQSAAQNFLNLFAKTNPIKEGVERMSKETKEAGANTVLQTPEVVTEKQLADNTSALYHGRTGEEKHSTTQKQLESTRKGEPEVLTEKQLDSDIKLHPRTEDKAEVVTEAQLERDSGGPSDRKGEDCHTTTQNQLNDNRSNDEPEVVTEKQLDNVSAPWARQANRDASLFKSAGDHTNAVIDAFASVSVETGATPQELQKIAKNLVAGTQARYDFVNAILDEQEVEKAVSFAKRASYWNAKNVKVATASIDDVKESVLNKLRVIASDTTINPDTIVEAVDVISDGDLGETSISSRIDEKLAEASTEVEEQVSVRDEIRSALQATTEPVEATTEEEVVEASTEDRDAERARILASLESTATTQEEVVESSSSVVEEQEGSILNREKVSDSDHVIETSFEEVGTTRTANSLRRDLTSFAKGALAGANLKLASITNVTISGDTIQIAVQTDAGEESVSIPIGEETAPMDAEVVPEGDLAGEGLENSLDAGAGAEMGGMENVSSAYASNNNKMQKEAQSPMGGGMPGGAGEGQAPGAPEMGMDGALPAGDGALQALTTGDEEDLGGEIPTVGEKQMPWSICPECGTSDVDVTKEDDGGIIGDCRACGAKYEAMIKKEIEFRIIKPTVSVGEEGEELPEGPEAPEEMPALPVAAQTKIDKNSIVRIASNKKANGEVCPSCGKTHCHVTASDHGYVKCACDACGTSFEKNLIVSSSNPANGILRVEWDLIPDEKCTDCRKIARKFASKLKVDNLLKTASSKADTFPMSNCMARMANEYGGDTVAMYGPCKDQPLAECVCSELQKLGFVKTRHMKKLAGVLMQKDPMDECLEDQKSKGHDMVKATSICNCIKDKFVTASDDNIYVQAFGDEAKEGKISLSTYDLETMNEQFVAEQNDLEKQAQAMIDDEELGDPLSDIEVSIDEVEVETLEDPAGDVTSVTITGDNLEVTENTSSDDEELSEDLDFEEPSLEGDTDMGLDNHDALAEALAMTSNRVRRSGAESNIKLAGKPTVIETIEKDVEAGVPRSNATIRNEGAENIDVSMAKPSVPRSSALMGHEKNVPATLPDVPVDSSYIGDEKRIQSGMPAINNEIKGTVIADTDRNVKEAKQFEQVDSVEKDVEAGVPRGDASIANESADNIDVKMADPDVPRTSETMGDEEGLTEGAPDVPVAGGKGGLLGEETQVGPAVNTKMLKQVEQSRNAQLERLANARKDEARNTAAWLASNGRIASDKGTFDNVVTALSHFEIDKIASVAEGMFPAKAVKTASATTQTKTAGLGLPALILDTPMPPVQNEKSFSEKLGDQFTVGSTLLDRSLDK